MLETMTIKELSEVAGVSPDTIKRVVRKIYPNLMVNGRTTKLSYTESISVIKETRKKNIIQPAQNAQVPIQNAQVDIQSIIQATVESTVNAMLRVQNATRQTEPRRQIAEPTVDYMTAFGYCRKAGLSNDAEYIKKFGRTAKRLCNEQGIMVKKLDDERFGTVNAYPIEILKITWKYV